jgi:hypothetical protein
MDTVRDFVQRPVFDKNSEQPKACHHVNGEANLQLRPCCSMYSSTKYHCHAGKLREATIRRGDATD